jgi:hypothetical protein
MKLNIGTASDTEMITGLRLLETVREYIRGQKIVSSETIYQCDHVAETSPAFIEDLCDTVGYHTDEESDD